LTNELSYRLTVREFLKLQGKYAYATKENNYNQLSYDEYKKWYEAVIKFVDWNRYE